MSCPLFSDSFNIISHLISFVKRFFKKIFFNCKYTVFTAFSYIIQYIYAIHRNLYIPSLCKVTIPLAAVNTIYSTAYHKLQVQTKAGFPK